MFVIVCAWFEMCLCALFVLYCVVLDVIALLVCVVRVFECVYACYL